MQPQRPSPLRKGPGILAGLSMLYSCVVPLCKWLLKLATHFITRKGEMERVLLSGSYSQMLHRKFVSSLRASRQLTGVRARVLGEAEFDVRELAAAIVLVKGMHAKTEAYRATLLPNLHLCLDAINRTNRLILAVVRLSQTPYSSHNAHNEQALETLWCDLCPSVVRSGGRFTKEWGVIGFQGADPASDFRGMGVLGLNQMCYFARNRQHTARVMVSEADLPYKGFPFAITGINITNLVLDMLTERKFSDRFDPQIETALAQFNSIYCDVYCLFHHWWNESAPKSIMEFPLVFGRFHAALNTFVVSNGTVPPSSWVTSSR